MEMASDNRNGISGLFPLPPFKRNVPPLVDHWPPAVKSSSVLVKMLPKWTYFTIKEAEVWGRESFVQGHITS